MGCTALAIIDAQNMFVHPDGHFGTLFSLKTLVTIGRTIDRIKIALDHCLASGMPIMYFCSHSHLRKNRDAFLRWDTRIVSKLRPPRSLANSTAVFWRVGREYDSFFSPRAARYMRCARIKKIRVAGFYGHRCVSSFIFEALQNHFFVEVITDGVYPSFTARRQDTLLWHLSKPAARQNIVFTALGDIVRKEK